MRYYLIAGEASGDLHGSNLIKELKILDAETQFRFFGGDLMQAQSDNLVKHYRELAFMGVFEVLANIRAIRKNMKLCKNDLLSYNPDVLILIDYPGFNMKIAEFAKKNGIKVFYFISPKIWAWKEWRVKKIKAYVDEMFTILPFETAFFKKHNYIVHYVGNPLVGLIEEFKSKALSNKDFRKKNALCEKPIIALVSGSRKQEIKQMLPVMAAMKEYHPDYQFVISGAPSIPADLYTTVLDGIEIPVIFNQTYELLNHSHCAVVTSGTATLETALFNVPQIVLYTFKGNKYLARLIRKLLIKVELFSLPNLILNEAAIKELVMEEMCSDHLKPEMNKLLNDSAYRNRIFQKYTRLQELVGKPGAAKRAAQKMVELLNK